MSEGPPLKHDGPTVDRVLVEVTVPAPADAVWAALRDPDKVKDWFGWDADSLKDEIDFIFVQHADADEATRTVQFRGTQDRFTLEPTADGSLVRIVRAAPADQEWTDVYDGMIEGWIAFMQQLRFAFTRHAGERRRTLFLAGTARADQVLMIELGLIDTGAPGEPWAGALGPEADAAGQVWHLSRRQTGVTVDAWGDGLLVAMERVPDEKKPTGEASVILTTYGLSDAGFAALEARWKSWWDERFTSAAMPSAD